MTISELKKLNLLTTILCWALLYSVADARIKRSYAARIDFKKSAPCPSTGKSTGSCPGYVIDHIVPLKRGGADDPKNMQWQTIKEAKEKDKWE